MEYFMQNRLLNLLCAFGATVLASSLKAQDADSLCYELTPVVTVAERRIEPETSVVPFRRIDSGDVTRYGMRALSEAVRMMPGVQVQDYGGVGGLKSVSVRGLGAKHTAVSYDGVVVSDAQSGMVDLGRFSLENVSAVSLVLGHGEVTLNTAREYSLASLVSMNGSLATSGKAVSSVKILGGSFGLAGLSACGGFSAKDGVFAASFAGNYLRSDGMYPFTLVNAIRSPLVSVNDESFLSYDTVGFRLPCLEWRIDNPNDEGIGEICVKGDVVMMGYYKNPEQTSEVLQDGWFFTGDYGYITKDDQLVITGRKKNIIVLNNGKNIYPEEIEKRIGNIDYITENVVRSLKNSRGEDYSLVAEVYIESDEEYNEEKVLSDIQEQLSDLPDYNNVTKVELRNEPFEKTTTRKIKR